MGAIPSRLSDTRQRLMKSILSFILFALLMAGCQQTNDQQSQNQTPELVLPEDFTEFYEKFHNDTAYQMAHIVWPLPGRPSMLDSTVNYQGGAYSYQKEDWIPHKPLSADTKFDREYEIVSDFIINETFSHRDMPITVLRRFAKTSDGWQLIFYAGPGN